MGLFAEALRQKSERANDPEVASLVNSINQSVDALEGLFGELLDITRIDSGGVDVQPGPVSIRDLFARLRLTFEPTAFEKGLALSFHGEQHFAHTDGLLLERILRNLVSNAIRYSEDGGVLVACRPRGGKLRRCRSGTAASASARPACRTSSTSSTRCRRAARSSRTSARALGLGLAIVKRLADLLEAPLTVRSRPGHGTVFTLELPVGRAPRSLAPATAGSAARLGITLRGRRIVVVEDEPAVREGLTVLLAAWGAEVDALRRPRRRCSSGWPRRRIEAPDLLIVDYRLPDGRTGVEALAALRARWPGSRCRPSWSPAAASAATRTKPTSTTSTC